ncbi:MAG: 4Fe-4S dicluster domain-containing protein [Chloroflexi bacterium]|nr:4Fe-4S dicluster domain-containing protein [Chloroflexota bacterium]
MANMKINKKDLVQLLGQWSQEFELFVPSRDGDNPRFLPWDGKDTGFLDWYRNTVIPPKSTMLPPVEEMFRFQKEKGKVQLEAPSADSKRRLLFGIRPCDANAMTLLDKNFEDGYEDPYYFNRRKNTLLVGLACTRPYDSCFCTSMGGSPSDASKVDIMLTDIGEQFLVEAVTDAGKDLIAKTGGLEEATEADAARAEESRKAAERKVTRKVDTSDITERLRASFEDKEFWEKTAAKCVSCGICTFLCPTCYCFFINDETNKQCGVRCKGWDSCAFSCYTRMPMENPRSEKWKRVRQKMAHKYEYYPMTYGVMACTGCGRCIRNCPVNWDITQVIKSVPAKARVESK